MRMPGTCLHLGAGSTSHTAPLLPRVRAGHPITTCSGMTTGSPRMSCRSSRTSCAIPTCAAPARSPSQPRHTTPDWWHSERDTISWTRSTTGEGALPAAPGGQTPGMGRGHEHPALVFESACVRAALQQTLSGGGDPHVAASS